MLDGNLILPVTIKAGIPIHFFAVVSFIQTGYWPVNAYVKELITRGSGPMGMYYDSPEDTVFIKVGADQGTFERLPQSPLVVIP